MHVLVHIYMVFLVCFYFFILLIRYWDDLFADSADVSKLGHSRLILPVGVLPQEGRNAVIVDSVGRLFRGQDSVLS